MLETVKRWFRDFNADFDFDFDPGDCSFLNWLRSLLMMLGAYWLVVAVPLAIVNYFRGGVPIGNDSFYIRYLDLRPFNFTPKYVGQTVVRLFLVGLWCAVLMFYGIFIYPLTHLSGGGWASDSSGGSVDRDKPEQDNPRQDRSRSAPQADTPRPPPSYSQPQPPPRSEPKQPVTIVTAYKKGATVYIRRSDGQERCITMMNVTVVNVTPDSVCVQRLNNPDKGIYIYDVDGYQKGYINVPS